MAAVAEHRFKMGWDYKNEGDPSWACIDRPFISQASPCRATFNELPWRGFALDTERSSEVEHLRSHLAKLIDSPFARCSG